VRRALFGSRLRIGISVTALVVVVLLVAGVVSAGLWLIDNIGAPGPAATGSGPCTSADSVVIQLVSADAGTVQACTRDRPACPNQTISGTANGQGQPDVSQFELNNQLRSSSRRYILSIRFDAALPAEAPEQTLTLAPGPGLLPGQPASTTLARATVDITPRDPTGSGFIAMSGSLTVSSTKGVAHGRFDGSFTAPARTDRPAPTPISGAPARVTGTFACNR
jgi:hypothetical protein